MTATEAVAATVTATEAVAATVAVAESEPVTDSESDADADADSETNAPSTRTQQRTTNAKPSNAPMHQRRVGDYDLGRASNSEGVPGSKKLKASSIW